MIFGISRNWYRIVTISINKSADVDFADEVLYNDIIFVWLFSANKKGDRCTWLN